MIKELIAESKIPGKAFVAGAEHIGDWEGTRLESGNAPVVML